MIEMQIKAKIKNRNELYNTLINLGCNFSDSVIQRDTIFLNNDGSFNIMPGDNIIRIRILKNKKIVTLKQRRSVINEPKDIEFEVSSYDSARDFIEILGYKEIVAVNKTRVETKYNGYNLCVDEVEKLGTFLEVKITTEKENTQDEVKTDIIKFINSLNLESYEIVDKHYDTMIYELNN